MSEFLPLEMIAATAKPVVLRYLAQAVIGREGADDDVAVSTLVAMAHAEYDRFIRTIAERVTAMDEETFNDSYLKGRLCDALILDTSMHVIGDIPGSDDSRADYMPDGNAQVAALIDDSYDGNGFLWHALHHYIDDGFDLAPWNDRVFFQDCTSQYLWDINKAVREILA